MDDFDAGTYVTRIDGRATALRIRRCRLEVIAGPDAGSAYEADKTTIRVGARSGADLVLRDGGVSGFHFEILVDQRGFRLRDLDSTNGTFVGGFRVNDIYLNPGTVIQVGTTHVRFEPLNEAVELPLAADDRFGGLIGGSVVMRELFARLERIAGVDTTVLVTGETGTGKDLVAEVLHERSSRVEGPFEVLDCGAIPTNLVESELFGHERGAFTGAQTSYTGAFERARGGTLFLDEIGELPMELQPKLLRAVERRQIRRVGGTSAITVDIRLVAATNRDLAIEVSRGRFREDLYYRLAVAQVHLPPLRERKDDIPLLVQHFLSVLPGSETARLGEKTLRLMSRHDWPGNVRELRNVVERAVLLLELPENTLALRSHSPVRQDERDGGGGPPRVSVELDIDVPFKMAKRAVVDAFERAFVAALLERHGGNISAAARATGVDRMSIHKIARRFDLKKG